MTWFYVTLAAVFFQTLRNLLQKSLRSKLGTIEVAWARIFSLLPFLLAAIGYFLATNRVFFLNIDSKFYIYCFSCGLMQIAATLCFVELLSRKNFSIGVAYTKTDTIQVAILAVIFLDESLPILGALAIILAFIAVALLAGDKKTGTFGFLTKIFYPEALLGMGSGLFLALTTIFMKKATLLAKAQSEDQFLAIIVVFTIYVVMQNISYIVYEKIKGRLNITVSNMMKNVAKISFIGFFSMLGTLGWIWAFLIQKVAYVKLVAQVEVLISLLISYLFLKESNSKKEIVGMILLIVSVGMILFGG